MPVMAIYRNEDVSSELYNAYRAQAPLVAAPPGALVHSYGRADRGFVTVDIWEDRKSLNAYIDEVIIPATKAVGADFVRPEVIDVETFLTTPGVTGHPTLDYAREPERA